MHVGGSAYLAPLSAGSVFPSLLSILSPNESPPCLVLAALRSLNTIADSFALQHPTFETVDSGFLEFLYTDQHLVSLAQIIDQTSPAVVVQQQISLAAALVTKTCREDIQRAALARLGVLDSLTARLATFVVATGVCSTLVHGPSTDAVNYIPPATTRSRLSPILQAISTIIANSKLRATQFVCAPAFAALFPKSEPDIHPWKAAWGPSINMSSAKRQGSSNLADNSLPKISTIHHHQNLVTQMTDIPPLGTLGSWGRQLRTIKGPSSTLEPTPTDAFSSTEDDESPLVMWLVHVIRAEYGVTRLMAAWVLTILYRSDLVNRKKETGLALLLVPLLVRMLDKDFSLPQDALPSYDNSTLQSPEWLITEQAPAVLAMLVVDSFDLQRAAVDADAIKKLSQLLKRSYDPSPENSSASLWTINGSSSGPSESQENATTIKIGTPGVPPLAIHLIKMRESVLIALAALASFKDEYRKAIIDNGVVPFVIESLKPYVRTKSTVDLPETKVDEARDQKNSLGNPTPVLLAACCTARALSRSVSTLRTSLIDADLAAPLFVLLKHEEIEVQVAATAVTCNLVLEFSPMREV